MIQMKSGVKLQWTDACSHTQARHRAENIRFLCTDRKDAEKMLQISHSYKNTYMCHSSSFSPPLRHLFGISQ